METTDPTIPFGWKRVTGQLQRGDGIYDYASGAFAKAKRVPTEVIIRKTKMLYPCAMPDGLFAIRKCTVEQTVIPGVEEVQVAIEPPEVTTIKNWDDPLPEMEVGE